MLLREQTLIEWTVILLRHHETRAIRPQLSVCNVEHTCTYWDILGGGRLIGTIRGSLANCGGVTMHKQIGCEFMQWLFVARARQPRKIRNEYEYAFNLLILWGFFINIKYTPNSIFDTSYLIWLTCVCRVFLLIQLYRPNDDDCRWHMICTDTWMLNHSGAISLCLPDARANACSFVYPDPTHSLCRIWFELCKEQMQWTRVLFACIYNLVK